MARFEASISPKVVEQIPTPAHLGTVLLINSGYVFGGARKEELDKDEQVGIYNLNTLFGYITYKRQPDGSVSVVITDVPNGHGDILTSAAQQLVER